MFKKFLLIALVAVLGFAALPTASVAASGLTDETTPPTGEVTGERLEKAWERALRLYERVGKLMDRAETLADRIQELIDKANEQGLDTSAVQAALDAFNDALKDAHPVYESAKGIINSHKGFDSDGNVTDPELAAETLKSLGEKLRELRELTGPSGKALREAIKAFREANPRSDASTGTNFVPSTSG